MNLLHICVTKQLTKCTHLQEMPKILETQQFVHFKNLRKTGFAATKQGLMWVFYYSFSYLGSFAKVSIPV